MKREREREHARACGLENNAADGGCAFRRSYPEEHRVGLSGAIWTSHARDRRARDSHERGNRACTKTPAVDVQVPSAPSDTAIFLFLF